MSEQWDAQKKNYGISGIAIPGGLLIGMGVGFFLDNIIGGIFVGLGAGFLVMMIAMVVLQKKGS